MYARHRQAFEFYDNAGSTIRAQKAALERSDNYLISLMVQW
jgi:hypothetical protein